jgi:hypothetical protein
MIQICDKIKYADILFPPKGMPQSHSVIRFQFLIAKRAQKRTTQIQFGHKTFLKESFLEHTKYTVTMTSAYNNIQYMFLYLAVLNRMSGGSGQVP